MAEFKVTAKSKTSGGTSSDGARVSDTSRWEQITLSGNEVFNPNDANVYTVNWIAQRGETEFNIEWDDYTEVIPGSGLKLPRTIRFRTLCRSPKVPPLSNIGVGGVAEAEITARSFKFT